MFDYQPFYCEENILRLCARGVVEAAVFVTNPSRACPMFGMRAAPSPTQPVWWDYHVVGATRAGEPQIWDLDCVGGCPLTAETWFHVTFAHLSKGVPEQLRLYAPWFRWVPAPAMASLFSSDRSHMIDERNVWLHPPPPWPPAFDEARGMNLERFLDIDDPIAGEVLNVEAFQVRMGI